MDDATGQYFMSDCADCCCAHSRVCACVLAYLVLQMGNGTCACGRASTRVILRLQNLNVVCVSAVRVIQPN